MSDYLVKATAFEGTVRAYALQSTDTVEEARRRQDTWATASAALGRTITISAMLGAMLKGEDKLTVKIEGGGPIGAIIATAMLKVKSVVMCLIPMWILNQMHKAN